MAEQRVLFFGRLGEILGRSRTFDLPSAERTIADLRQILLDLDEDLAGLLGDRCVRACVDGVIATEDAVVLTGQELAFIPPLSGG